MAWASFIFCLSMPTFGPHRSGRLLVLGLRPAYWRLSWRTFGLLHIVLRKLAHVTEYAILALLLNAGAGDGEQMGWRPRRAALRIAAASAYSLSDELHQRFAPGRHCSILDFGIDTFGASLAMLAPYLKSKPWRGLRVPVPQR